MNIFDKRPLFIIITALISGFVSFTFSDGVVRGLLLLFSILALILSLIFYYKKRFCNLLFIIVPISLLLSMICSYLYFDVHFKLYEQYSSEVEIEGKIMSVEEGSFSSTIIVKTSKINQKNKGGYKVRLSIPNYSLSEEFVPGTLVSFRATLSKFEDFSDIDATAFYFSKGICSDTTDVSDLTYIGKGTVPISTQLDFLRVQLSVRAEKFTSDKTRSLFIALFLGERDLLDDQIKLDFKRLGITHILALSGSHLTMLSIGISKMLSIIKVKKKPRLVIVSVFIIAYMVLTGLSVSIVRAGIMFLLSSALFLLKKTKDSVTSLSVSVLIILIISPYAVYDLALWLSALSTLGIVAMVDIEDYEPKKDILHTIRDAVIISFKSTLYATSAILLVSLYAFKSLSLASAMATFIFSLLSEAIMYIGMLMLMLGDIIPIGVILDLISDATYSLANAMARPDWVYLSSDYVIVTIVTIAYSIGFILFLSLCLKNKKRATLILTICFILVMSLSLVTNLVGANKDAAIYNTYEDGDRIILRSDSKVALISSAAYSSSGAYEGYRLLSDNQITYLNLYYLTGYSSGLMTDVLKIMSLMKVDTVCLPYPDSESEKIILEDLTDELTDRGTTISLYKIDEQIIWHEYKICALYRTKNGSSRPKNAFCITKNDIKMLYLSAGMMHGKEKILAFDMIADSNIVLFGTKDYKKYGNVIFDVYNENIKKIYIENEKVSIQYTIAAAYEKSGTEICRDATVSLFD